MFVQKLSVFGQTWNVELTVPGEPDFPFLFLPPPSLEQEQENEIDVDHSKIPVIALPSASVYKVTNEVDWNGKRKEAGWSQEKLGAVIEGALGKDERILGELVVGGMSNHFVCQTRSGIYGCVAHKADPDDGTLIIRIEKVSAVVKWKGEEYFVFEEDTVGVIFGDKAWEIYNIVKGHPIEK